MITSKHVCHQKKTTEKRHQHACHQCLSSKDDCGLPQDSKICVYVPQNISEKILKRIRKAIISKRSLFCWGLKKIIACRLVQRATVSTVRSLKHSRGGEERLEKRQKLEKIPNLGPRFEKSQKRRKCQKSWQSTNQSGGLIKILDVKFGAFHPAGGENHRARGESLLIATAEWSYLMPLCTATSDSLLFRIGTLEGSFLDGIKAAFCNNNKNS